MISAGRRARNRPPTLQPFDLRTERRVVIVGVVIVVAAAVIWLSAGLASLLSGHGFHDVEPRAAIGTLFGVVAHPGAPARAFPSPMRRDVPAAPVFWLVVASIAVAITAVCLSLKRSMTRKRPAKARRTPPSGWARPSDLAPVVVQRPTRGRLVVGRCGRSLVATEPGHSLLVVGPTQSGKTTGLAIPAILEWDGPVVATSVKTDLVTSTAADRARLGAVAIYDPLGVSGSARASWSPLVAATTFLGARRVAASLCSVQRESGRSPEDAAFWGSLGEKLLAPLLFAAATDGRSMRDVVSWVDTGEVAEVLDVLERTGDFDALRCARASFGREERQLASVYATTEAAISAFGDPLVDAQDGAISIDVRSLSARASDTCYLVAPAHEQERLRPVFVALLREILDEAFTAAARRGRLDPPLLVVLDEAANIAPVSNLDALASTASSHGIQLVTVWQDFAQIAARYGGRAATVVNNHRAKLIFPGVSDPDTLEQFSKLIGDDSITIESVTTDALGAVSSTRSENERRLVSAADLRTLESGEAILLYGRLPPVRVALRMRARARRGRFGISTRTVGSERG
ncbi:MAG: type IV secretory system conjugative DNA transfer family protein [Acidimicrobiales bacterium]